jgi:carboxymethylenebutenolidase
MSHFVNLTSSDGFIVPAYVAEPAGKASAAIVVIQESFGVNSHIQSVADKFAAAGYLAVAPAMFQRVESGVNLGYTEEDMKAGFALKTASAALPAPGVMRDIQAAIDYAAQMSGAGTEFGKLGKVGIVGFCWGGLLTWRAACTLNGLSAAVPYYGGGMTGPQEVAREPICSVMAQFADADSYIPLDSIHAFAKAQPGVHTHIYPGHHGFNCDQRGSFDAAAAELAMTRTLAFFAEHLVAEAL